jgi:hypothetical protein
VWRKAINLAKALPGRERKVEGSIPQRLDSMPYKYAHLEAGPRSEPPREPNFTTKIAPISQPPKIYKRDKKL